MDSALLESNTPLRYGTYSGRNNNQIDYLSRSLPELRLSLNQSTKKRKNVCDFNVKRKLFCWLASNSRKEEKLQILWASYRLMAYVCLQNSLRDFTTPTSVIQTKLPHSKRKRPQPSHWCISGTYLAPNTVCREPGVYSQGLFYKVLAC